MIADIKTLLAAALLLSASASAQDTINLTSSKLSIPVAPNPLSHLRGRASSGTCPAVPCASGYICATLQNPDGSVGAPTCYNPNPCSYSYTTGNTLHQTTTYCAYGTQCTSDGCSATLPSSSASPSASASPSTSAHPSSSASPSASAHPSSSASPSVSAHPSSSASPSASAHPSSSASPSASAHPSSSASPSASAHPSSSASPSPSHAAAGPSCPPGYYVQLDGFSSTGYDCLSIDVCSYTLDVYGWDIDLTDNCLLGMHCTSHGCDF